MHLALYHPDIPQNLGSMLRLCACLEVTCHIIEPCGFPFDDKRIRRSGMDYINHVQWIRYVSWDEFLSISQQNAQRLILLTTKATEPYYSVKYARNDILLMGSESAGVPSSVADACHLRITIPMNKAVRSLNVGLAAAIAVAEAKRQLA